VNEQALIKWIDQHAPLLELCERGGWPDATTLRMDVCSRTDNEWLVDIFFIEAIQEISECDPLRSERCGKFAISFNANGQPQAIRLKYPM